MNSACCNHRCNQGRECPSRLRDWSGAGEQVEHGESIPILPSPEQAESWAVLAWSIALYIAGFLACAAVLAAAMVLPLP